MPPIKSPSSDLSLLKDPLFWIFLCGLLALGSALAIIFETSLFLPVLVIGSIVALVLLFRSPLILLLSLVIIRMSLDYSSQYFSFSIRDLSFSLSQLLGIGIAILGFVLILLYRRSLPGFKLNLPFLLLFVWGIFSLAYSIAPRGSLQELMRFFDLFVLGFLAYVAVSKTEDYKKLLLAFFGSSILPILFGLYQFIFKIGLQDENVSVLRIFGTFSHPNVYSLYLFVMIVFGILYYILFAHTKKSRMLTLSLVTLLVSILILTFARVAWVALFSFIFFVALFRYRFLLFPLFLFPFVLYVFSPTFQERVNESLHPDPGSSIVWRKTLWNDVTNKSIQDGNLLLGTGVDTFPKVSESVRGGSLGPHEPHNDFVKFFVEGGIIGLIVYILYLFSILFILVRSYFKSRPESALRLSYGFMTLLFLSLMLASLTDNVFKNTPVQWLFFTALGGLLALSKKE